MAKHPETSPPSKTPLTGQRGIREVDILAALAAALCIGVGVLSINALNPDGVSYLDLAAALQRGDWSHFVQGYWSPLFPFLVGGIGQLINRGGAGLVPVTHIINTVAALIAVLILWRWARMPATPSFATAQDKRPTSQVPGPFGRALIAAFLICGAGLPRIEAVTPDVILFLAAIALSYELIAHAGKRWLLVGLLLGIAFLAKTSCWPWLLVAVPVRFWAAMSATERRRVMLSTIAALAIVLTWVMPMSIKYGRPTLGTSGALNWSWYMKANSSRLPDTDQGANLAYRDIDVGNNRLLTMATLDDAAYWTYQPWGDPTDWSAKVLSQTGRLPSPGEMIVFWLRMTARVFGLWLGPLILAALLPWLWLRYRPGIFRELFTTQRDALAVMILGLVGVLQFVAVHAEPRLIAPFAAMLALGTLHWCFNGSVPSENAVGPAPLRQGLAWLGLAAAVGFAVPRMIEGVQSAERLRNVTAQLGELRRRIAMVSDGPLPIAVVGPAAPIMASAFWVNAHIAMQVPPRFADLIRALPAEEQKQMLLTLFRGKVPMIWKTTADGGLEMLLVPQQ